MANETEGASQVLFLDSLPGIKREGTPGEGKWASKVESLRESPNAWALVAGPLANPYSIASNLNGGKAAGVDPNEFEFVARQVDPAEAKSYGIPVDTRTDKQRGTVTDEETGEVSQVPADTGYVFGRFITGDVAAEVVSKRNERKAKAAATRAKNGTTPGRRASEASTEDALV